MLADAMRSADGTEPGADRGSHAGSPRGVVVATGCNLSTGFARPGELARVQWRHPLASAHGSVPNCSDVRC